ncbi:MAG: 50S ribosomal protein L22 [Parcubacteria group bacterium]|nr:50S ribosomal protein L22 [Parcubacteria group bacterium]
MKALLRNYRQSPRKVRLVADLIRGKNVPRALTLLDSTTKRAVAPVKKLLLSAVANAKTNNRVASESALYVKEIRVDGGATLKRGMPRAFGRSAPIRKRTSHIFIELAQRKQESRGPAIKGQKKKSPRS